MAIATQATFTMVMTPRSADGTDETLSCQSNDWHRIDAPFSGQHGRDRIHPMYVFLFDIDGTLIWSGGAGQAALQDAMEKEFGISNPETVPVHGLTDRVIASSLFACHGIDDSFDNWRRFIAAYLRALPKKLPEREGCILPGVSQLLEQLSQRSDVALGLLTGNVPDGARIKLEFYGLYDRFHFGGFGENHHRREDVATEALQAARNHLDGQVDVSRTFVIGDTPNDVRCGRHIEARVVAVSTGKHSNDELCAAEPDLLLEDFSDPSPLLEMLA